MEYKELVHCGEHEIAEIIVDNESAHCTVLGQNGSMPDSTRFCKNHIQESHHSFPMYIDISLAKRLQLIYTTWPLTSIIIWLLHNLVEASMYQTVFKYELLAITAVRHAAPLTYKANNMQKRAFMAS